MTGRFEDERGVIMDWFLPADAVTWISTVKDAVRGNHVHHETTQWTLVLKGRLLMASGDERTEMGPLDMVKHDPGDPHAWRALEDSECLVFTKGPRAGDDYETDVHRLDVPLLE